MLQDITVTVVVAAVDIRIEVMITGEEVMEAVTITEYVHLHLLYYHLRDFSSSC